MSSKFSYIRVKSLDEAIEHLSSPGARVQARGDRPHRMPSRPYL